MSTLIVLTNGMTEVKLNSLIHLSQHREYGCRRTAATAEYRKQFPCMVVTEIWPKLHWQKPKPGQKSFYRQFWHRNRSRSWNSSASSLLCAYICRISTFNKIFNKSFSEKLNEIFMQSENFNKFFMQAKFHEILHHYLQKQATIELGLKI